MAEEELGARLRLRDRREFSADADRAARDVKNIGDEADKADRKGRNMAGGMGMASKGIGGLATASTLGITAVAALGAGVGFLGLKTIGLAMDAGETASKFNTVFAGMEDQVGGFVKQMNADYGIPTKELQDAAAGFGIFAKAAGVPKKQLAEFSTDLTTAGMDLASFYNAEPGDVFAALKSGLAGEAEPLKQFGIFLSESQMKAQAAAMGLKGELSEGQKVMVRQAIILKGLGDAQGDLGRTSGGLANQFKGLKGRFTEAGTAIGTAFLPYATSLVNYINTNMAPAVAWLQTELPGMVTDGTAAVTGAYERMQSSWNSGGSFGDVAADVTGMQSLVDPVNKVADALGDVWTIARDGIIPAFKTVQDAVPGLQSPLAMLDSTLDFLARNAETLHPLLVGLVAVFTAWKFAVIAHNVVMAVSGFLMAARVGTTMLLTGATGLNTGAELTRNQALVASIALHVRMGAMMVANAIKTVASTALTVAAVVGGWIVMGATALVQGGIIAAQWVWMGLKALANVAIMAVQGAIVVGSWILMGATAMASGLMMAAAWILGLGPIGLAIAALLLIGGIFVALWMKSETFRNIVKGALSAVGTAAVAAKDWIVNAFNAVVGFFSGLPGRISAVTGGMFDGVKNAFKAAINWLIDKWNGFSLGIPAVDTKIPGVGKVGGFTLNTPDIPRLHSGGTTTSSGLVNMRPDEELIVLPSAASVVPMNDDLRSMAAEVASGGGRGDGPIVLQLVVDRKVLAETVYEHTGDKVARD